MEEASKVPPSEFGQESAQQIIKRVFSRLDWVPVEED